MARKRTFDTEKALAAMLGVFWRNGYEGTRYADLMRASGLGKGSLYAAFGDKDALYLAALRAYIEEELKSLATLIASAPSEREKAAACLDRAITPARQGDRRGCFLCNAAVETAPRSEPVDLLVQSAMKACTALFSEITGDPARGAILFAGFVGLRVMARGGARPAALDAARDAALRGLGVELAAPPPYTEHDMTSRSKTMPLRLSFDQPDFDARFEDLLALKREEAADVDDAVAAIIADVRARGIEAVEAMTHQFDGFDLTAENIAISRKEIDAATAGIPITQRDALELAAERIAAYHAKQIPEDARWTDPSGAELGWRWTPVESAGLYVPGGIAAYPSSVLMNAIPARVAGVNRLVIASPTPGGQANPLVLLAARLSGVEEIYRIGGAQAIAALAYGAGPIRPVDKITGPGNAYVAAAKRRVFGHVGIDMIAGPSEILIIADRDNNPDWIALDLMSQAEHDESAQSILITDDAEFAEAVSKAVERRLLMLERRAVAAASWRRFGALIVVKDMEQAAALSDRIAPEHLELCVADAEGLSTRIKHAGAIFIGAHTPEAIGDYVGGPNHVLPTARSARFSSGLSVLDFMKRTTLARMSPGALRDIGPAAETLARAEGLEAHGLSVRARLDLLNG